MPKLSPITQDLILRSKAYQQGMADANKKLKRFQKSGAGASTVASKLGGNIKMLGAAALGAAGIGGLGSLIQSSIQYGSSMSDMAEQNRIGTAELQVLNAVADKAGVGIQDLTRSMRNVNIRTQEALDGNKNYNDALTRLGFSARKFSELRTERKLEEIAKAYARAGKSQQAYADVAVILGQKAGPKMLEVLRRLNDEGFDELQRSAKEAGLVMEQDTINRLDAAADAIGRFKLRATIQVGELIAGESDGAAIKELGYKLMGVAGRFGGALMDRIVALGNVIQAGIGGTFQYVVDRFKSAMDGAIDAIRLQLVKMAIGSAKLNPFSADLYNELVSRENMLKREIREKRAADEVGQKSWSDFFEGNIRNVTNFQKEFGSFWDAKAKGQRDLLEASRKAASDAEASAAKISNALSAVGGTMDSGPDSAGRQAKIKELRLAQLKAEARGEVAISEALKNRITLAERVDRIMSSTNATMREALVIANKQVRAELAKSSGGAMPAGQKKGKGVAPVGARGLSMRDRERMAGLYNTTLGRDGARLDGLSPAMPSVAGVSAAPVKEASAKSESSDVVEVLKEILKVFQSPARAQTA